jgi:hypothetical protein
MWALKEINTKSRKNNFSWDNKELFYIYTLVHWSTNWSTNWYHWLLQTLEKMYSPDYTKEFHWETISMLRKSHALAKEQITVWVLSLFIESCMYIHSKKTIF